MDDTRRFRWGTALIASLMVFGLVAAGDMQDKTTSTSPGAVSGMEAFSSDIHSCQKLIGAKVQDAAGDDLGDLKEIVVLPGESRIAYGVLSYGGFLGMGDKYFAIPWTAFSMQPAAEGEELALVLNVDKETLDQAEGFDQDNWPASADPQFARLTGTTTGRDISREIGRDIERGVDATRDAARDIRTGEERETARVDQDIAVDRDIVKLSEVIGWDVAKQDDKIGAIDDAMIDVRNGHVVYAILDFGGIMDDMGDRVSIIPWSALRLDTEASLARTEVDTSTLRTFAFERDQLPDLSDQSYAMRIHNEYDVEPYWQAFGYVGAEGQAAFEAWQMGSEYNRKYDARNVTTVQGVIQSVSSFMPATGAAEGVHLNVRTDDGQMLIVHAGPKAYVDKHELRFSTGDRITVTGSKADFQGRQVLMASKIDKDDQTLLLRDAQGNPQWKAEDLQYKGADTQREMKSPSGQERSPSRTDTY